MLTELQERILHAVRQDAISGEFALAGGAALILHGVVDRQTRDLDFFTPNIEAVSASRDRFEAAMIDAGMTVTVLRETPGFVRFVVSWKDQVAEVDLANDARLRPTVQSEFGEILDLQELAADKTLALFGRAEARDFIDVHALAKELGEQQLCELASTKDPGFDEGRMVEALGAFGRLGRDEFEVDSSTYVQLRTWASEWQARLRARSLGVDTPETLDRSRGPDVREF